MDIKIDRGFSVSEATNGFEAYAFDKVHKYFDHYTFLQSVQIYLRGQKHPTKKVKLRMNLKGKEIFSEAKGYKHHDAFDNALTKMAAQLAKHKSKRYSAA